MRATCEVWDANLKAFLVLLRLVFDDLPVLVKNLPHPGVPLENAVIQPNVRRREVDALNEEGQAILRIHQSLRQLHHVGGLHLLNVSLQENTQVTDRLVRAPRKDTRAGASEPWPPTGYISTVPTPSQEDAGYSWKIKRAPGELFHLFF